MFVDGLESLPVVCGVATIDDKARYGEFRYGKSFLARKDAFPLDPVNLPLSDTLFTVRNPKGVFGVLSDAGADSWGEKIILSLHKTKPQNALEFLLVGAGMGVGALVFSLSSSASKLKKNRNTLGDLPTLLKAKDALINDQTIPKEARKIFEYGSSMGGARPKTTVVDGETAYLAKFNRPDDLFNHVKVEHASMRMLAELQCTVADTQVKQTLNGDVLLVKRFEQYGTKPTHHFISANALINTSVITPEVLLKQYSYGFIAEVIQQFGSEPEDMFELFRRMVFNVFIGNTDDHTRNHGLLFSLQNRDWRLSPAYDVLPINTSGQHGLGIGDRGREGTIENLLSQSQRFGLKQFKAQRIINDVKELVSEWPTYFAKLNVGDGDLERLKGIIPNIYY